MFKAASGRLISLSRERQQNEVQLLRHELTQAEQQTFLARLRNLLAGLTTSLDTADYALIGQVPDEADVLGRLQTWLTQYDGTVIAATPHAKISTKRRRP